MPIPSDPTIVPPSAEKTFGHQWILNLSVHAPNAQAGNFKIDLLPYDAATQEIGPITHKERVQSSEFWRVAAEVPEFQSAMNAVFDAIPAVKAWLQAEQEKIVAESGEVITE